MTDPEQQISISVEGKVQLALQENEQFLGSLKGSNACVALADYYASTLSAARARLVADEFTMRRLLGELKQQQCVLTERDRKQQELDQRLDQLAQRIEEQDRKSIEQKLRIDSAIRVLDQHSALIPEETERELREALTD